MNEKQCSTCRLMKPATTEHFYRASKTKDGFQARCIACDKTRSSAISADRWAQQLASRVTRKPFAPAVNYRGVRGGPLLAGYVS